MCFWAYYRMRLDKNSYGTVAAVLAVCLAGILLVLRFLNPLWLKILLCAIFAVLGAFIVFFFRVPERRRMGSGTTVTSVADGKIVLVEKAMEKEYLGRECIKVAVFMDFFDVHANFWPVSGEITYYKYHPGKYLLAFLPKSSELNEHSSTCIRTPGGSEVFFRQIAGTFARRLVCYSKVGMQVESGEQCGVIKFGSRIDLYLPLDAELKVKVGDSLKACESVIATLR